MFMTALLKTVFLPPLLAVMAIFFVCREVVRLLLYLQHGSRFGGLLSVYDAVHAVKNAEKNPVCAVFIIQHSGTSSFYELARRNLLEKLMVCSRTNTKAFSVLRRSMGYPYLIKIFPDIFDYVKRLDRKFESRQELMAFLDENVANPLPKDGQALWDLQIGTRPISWHGDAHSFYPIVLRFNHVLSDGESMARTVLGVFADKEDFEVPADSKKTKAPLGLLARVNFQLLFKQLYLLCMAPAVILEQHLRVREDANALHGRPLSEERVYVVDTEEVPRYVPLVKEIKSKVPKCSFSDVVLTAVSASLEAYFLQQAEPVPHRLTVAFPESSKTTRMLQAQPSSNCLNEPVCRNELSHSVRKLFISSGSKISLVQRLQKIKESNRLQKDPVEIEIGYWAGTMFYGLLPNFISAATMSFARITMIISNMPGPATISVFGGCKVQEMIPFGALRERTGVFLAIYTYAGRLTTTLIVDKALVKNREEVEAIVDNIYRYLDVLAEELEIKRNHHVLLI